MNFRFDLLPLLFAVATQSGAQQPVGSAPNPVVQDSGKAVPLAVDVIRELQRSQDPVASEKWRIVEAKARIGREAAIAPLHLLLQWERTGVISSQMRVDAEGVMQSIPASLLFGDQLYAQLVQPFPWTDPEAERAFAMAALEVAKLVHTASGGLFQQAFDVRGAWRTAISRTLAITPDATLARIMKLQPENKQVGLPVDISQLQSLFGRPTPAELGGQTTYSSGGSSETEEGALMLAIMTVIALAVASAFGLFLRNLISRGSPEKRI